jgi:hypothetical protein
MQKLKNILRKYRWLLLAIAVVLVGMRIELLRVQEAFHSKAYQGYVMTYVSAQKRLTGKWPTDLNGLPRYVESERNQTEAYYVRERLEIVLNYHQRNYEKIEAVRKDGKSYTYILHLKGEKMECNSEIDDK